MRSTDRDRGASYERSLRRLLGERAHDAVVAIFVPPLGGRAAEVARAIAAAAAGADRPVLGVWLGADAPAATDAGAVPRFSTPEEAVRALVHAVRHARRRAAPPDPPSEPAGVDSATAATIVAGGLGGAGGWLPPADVERLLRCWGIPVVASRLVASAAAAARAAAELGGAVALKAVVPGAGHKSDAGGVRLDLAGPTAVRRAAREIARRLEDAGTPTEGFEVQRMAPAGTELIVGAVRDPAFGPLVACGAGGPAGELLGDVQIRLAPLGPREADAMLRDLRTFPLLDGYRGRPPADLDSLRDIVMRVGALVATHPAVAELDLDPVIASPSGALVVDARVRLEAPGARPRRSRRSTSRARRCTGRRACTVVPLGPVSISSSPPASLTRSRMPMRPKPAVRDSRSKPRPSSVTATSTEPSRSVTSIATRPAPAWRTALVSDSCTRR